MLLIAALAQAAAAVAAPAAETPVQGVTSYPPSFFAAQQPGNAAEMVGRLPGFALDEGEQVRGFEGAAGNVLIDGQRPASKTDELDDILRRIPAAQVARIDVIRGGAPGIDMQGTTVIANVVRTGQGGNRLLVAGSQNHTSDGRTGAATRIEASGGKGQRKWELGFFGGKGIDDGAGDGPGVQIFANGRPTETSFITSEGDGVDAILTGTFETPLLGWKMRLNGRLADNKFKYDEDNTFLTPARRLETTDNVYTTQQTEVGANLSRALNARTGLELVGLRQTRDRGVGSAFAAPGELSRFNLERQTVETIGRAVLKYRFTDKLSAEAGGEAALNELDSATTFSVNGAPIRLPAANVQVEEVRYEAFVKAAWRPTPKWTADAGLRFESSDISSAGDLVLSKALHFIKPRLAVTWSPRTSTQLRMRLEREVGQLNFNDFVASANLNTGAGVVVGNPDLDPEQAWVGEVAVEQRFLGAAVAVLTYRHSELSDVIDRGPVFTPTGVFDRPTNIGEGTKDEVGLELTLPFDKLGLEGAQLRGEVTRSWSKVTDPTTLRSREISDLRPIDWEASFSHDLPRYRLTYGVDAYGGWRERAYRFNLIETTKLKTYVKPFLEWRPVGDVNIRFELPNVTSRGIRRTLEIYPGARSAGGRPDIEDRDIQFGRMYYVRVRKTFGG